MKRLTKNEVLDLLGYFDENPDASRHTRSRTNTDASRRTDSGVTVDYASWPEWPEESETGATSRRPKESDKEFAEKDAIAYRYEENRILDEIRAHIDSTYSGDDHYVTNSEENGSEMQCFDAMMALGDASSTFRDISLKYLWRYGKKNGKNRKDILKAIHYLILLLYVDRRED